MAGILITGGSGRLGRALLRAAAIHYPGVPFVAPSRNELDILSTSSCCNVLHDIDPDVVIHAAAFADSYGCERDYNRAWLVNVIGTENMLRASRQRRFVFISTDYVFDGEKGNYHEGSTPRPRNYYGVTKLAAEMIVRQRPNTLILRAPFRPDGPWRYPKAFIDQYTSCVFVSERAPDILEAGGLPITGILHIGGPRRSIYHMAKGVSPSVGKAEIANSPVPLPADTSLDDSRWQNYKETLSNAHPVYQPSQ